MASEFAHLHTDDPLGLATAGDIVLVNVSGGIRRDFVEMLSEKGIYVPAAAQAIKPVEEFQVEYELRSTALTVPLGQLVNGSYLVTALSAQSDSGKYPTVTVTVIKFSATNKLLTSVLAETVSSALSQDITGGFGLVNKYGVSGTIRGISSSMSISMQAAERMEETSGDYLQSGYVQYGFKREVTIESYTEVGSGATVSGVSGAKVTARDTKTARDGYKTFSVSYFEYLGVS